MRSVWSRPTKNINKQAHLFRKEKEGFSARVDIRSHSTIEEH